MAGRDLISHPETSRIDSELVYLVMNDALGCAQEFGSLTLVSLCAHEGVDNESPLISVHQTSQGRHIPASHFIRFHDFSPRLVIVYDEL
jgi:hypothetical protein